MGTIYNQVLEKVDDGMKGRNRGLPMGLPRVSKVIYDVQRGRYDLIGGKTSSGKTAFVDQCYVVEPFLYALNHPEVKLDILYFSLEISPVAKFTKIAARFLYEKHGDMVDSNKLLSRGDYKLSSEIRTRMNGLKEGFDKLEDVVHIYDAYTSRADIMGKVRDFLDEHGEYSETGGRLIYTPHHKNHYVIAIVDTANLITTEGRENKKQAMDGLSKDFLKARNITGLSPVMIQQLNADISDPRRIQQRRYEPMVDDLEDTKGLSKDAENIMFIYDPLAANINIHRDYDVARLNGKFRQLQIVKNRDGNRGDRIGLHLNGGVGIFTELPRAAEMTDRHYQDYG